MCWPSSKEEKNEDIGQSKKDTQVAKEFEIKVTGRGGMDWQKSAKEKEEFWKVEGKVFSWEKWILCAKSE